MVIEKVKEALANQLGIKPADIDDDANIIEDLNADSLDVIEMLMSLETDFGVTIPDDKINTVKTVREVAELIESCQK